MRVRLTRLRDGDVVAISLAHSTLDGPRLPALARHLAARYRQLATGARPDPAELINPTTDRPAVMSMAGLSKR
jgi:hypothetical protein